MKRELRLAIYQRAVDRHSWSTLIPYPGLLATYQIYAASIGDIKTVRAISAVCSHILGRNCSKVCKSPLLPDHKHHRYCKPNCLKIERFIKNSLTRQLLEVLALKLSHGQQLLLDND